MDLAFKPEHAAFRAEVRAWIEASFPQAIRDKQATGEHLNKEEILSWHRILYAKGWLTPSWPKEYGGRAGIRCSATSGPRNWPGPIPASRPSASA